jgi:DNA polymerase-3 subunit epsilon
VRHTIDTVCGCFPTGRHYPGIADLLAQASASDEHIVAGLVAEFAPQTEWAHAPLAVIDFETTGLDAELDRVIELGIVCVDRGEITHVGNWLINPMMPIPEAASSVHGITNDVVAQSPTFAELVREWMPLLHGRLPVAYNADFDRKFLHAEFRRYQSQLDTPADVSAMAPALRQDAVWIDPLVWVRELQKYERGKKLTDVCARMGIELSNAHRASGDAEATAKVLMALRKDLPSAYSELIRLQVQYAARQEAERQAWRSRG